MHDRGEAKVSKKKCAMEIVENYAFFRNGDSYLGQGAFGQVYRGFNVDDLVEKVAVKSIAAEKCKRQELGLLMAVKSEYLVKLLLISTRRDTTFVVMELCDGDLAGHLARWTNLDPAQATLLADNLARGYKVLHSNKIVHRDIKPQNILIKYKASEMTNAATVSGQCCGAARGGVIGMAKLSDFGTSHLMKCDEDELCNVAGTLFYMAPEVGANLVATKTYDHSADMWSIGCVLYESITGNTPFDENYMCKLFLRVACKNYTDCQTLTATLPSAYADTFDYVPAALLLLDPKVRMTAQQFYDRAVDELSKTSTKPNVRHRFKTIDKHKQQLLGEVDFYSKSLTHFNRAGLVTMRACCADVTGNVKIREGVRGGSKPLNSTTGLTGVEQFRTMSDNVLCKNRMQTS